jgi:hypothetical protein
MTPLGSQVTQTAACIAGAFVVLVGGVAAGVALADPNGVRTALHFGFGHVPRVPAQAVAIFLNNLRLLCVPLLMAVDVHLRVAISSSRGRRAYVAFCDLVAIAPALNNIMIIGASVGAYGMRMVSAMLPFGPVEIAAFATAASVYVHARRADSVRGLPALLSPTAAAVLLLAVAAALEALL